WPEFFDLFLKKLGIAAGCKPHNLEPMTELIDDFEAAATDRTG
ncbi:unnamed protein product, partial [marine sediment metagenome]